MYILVIDDEAIIRDWLQATLTALFPDMLEVHCASDGQEALEMLDICHYEMVFIDILMPRMNGIDFLKELNRRNTEIIPIILSSHDQFDYARECIRYGAFDYVLKYECNKNMLRNLVNRCIEERKPTMVPPASSSALMRIFSDSAEAFTAVNWSLVFPKFQAASFYCIATGECLKDDLLPFFFIGTYEERYYYLIDSIHCGNQCSRLLSFFSAAAPQCFGVSLCYKTMMKLPVSVKNAAQSWERLFYSDTNCFFDCINQVPATEYEIQTACNKYISNGRNYQATELLQNLLPIHAAVEHVKPVSVMLVKDSYLNILNSLYLCYYKKQDNLINKLDEIKRKIYDCKSFRQLISLVENLIIDDIYLLSCSNGYSEHVKKAQVYIAEYYNIVTTIGEIADYVHLNADYFSRLFKKETGHTINSYITLYKLEMAALLLRTTNRSISDVALDVNIPNISYFSKRFKEKYGLQPNQYRINHRNSYTAEDCL